MNSFSNNLVNDVHPNVHQPWRQWSEDQTLHIIGVYSNPMRWRTRRELFSDFVYHMEQTPNVELHIVEIAFAGRPHEVTGSRKNDVQLRTNSVLWHKEIAINRAVQTFPDDWQFGGYVDGDFHMTRHDWALEAIHLLQHHDFVQLFSSYEDLTGKMPHSDGGYRPYRMNASYVWNYQHQQAFLRRKLAGGDSNSDVYYHVTAPSDVFPFGYAPGATGGAWAWRRPAFDQVGGLLDTHIVGGADWDMAFGFLGLLTLGHSRLATSPAYLQAALAWQEHAAPLHANLGCVDNHAIHYYHGSKFQRAYSDRWQILKDNQFDPVLDLKRNWQGIWEWAGNKPGLRDDVLKYNLGRNEDDTHLPIEKSLV